MKGLAVHGNVLSKDLSSSFRSSSETRYNPTLDETEDSEKVISVANEISDTLPEMPGNAGNKRYNLRSRKCLSYK